MTRTANAYPAGCSGPTVDGSIQGMAAPAIIASGTLA